MRFKGHNFRISKTIVTLPALYNPPYIYFGKVCKATEPGATLTNWKTPEGEAVYAMQLPCDGHSLTNMMYSGDRLILMYDGKVYTAKFR